MLMTAEDAVRMKLDELYPKPVPYIGRPTHGEVTNTARQIERAMSAERRAKAQARTEYLAQLDLERARKRALSESQPDVTIILAAVACVYGITTSVILSRTKNNKVAHARQHVIWELKCRKPTMSSVAVGELLNRDCSTVRDGLKVFEARKHREKDKIEAVAKLLA